MVFPLLVCLLPFGLAQVTVWPYGNFGQPSFAPWGQFGQGQASTRGPFDQIGQGRPQPPFNPFVSSFTLPPQGPAGTLPPFGPFTTGGRGPPPGLPQATTPAPPTGTPFLINSGAGQIQGLVVTDSKSGGRYGVFLGIPYAQPPVGNLRFQVSLPGLKFIGHGAIPLYS